MSFPQVYTHVQTVKAHHNYKKFSTREISNIKTYCLFPFQKDSVSKSPWAMHGSPALVHIDWGRRATRLNHLVCPSTSQPHAYSQIYRLHLHKANTNILMKWSSLRPRLLHLRNNTLLYKYLPTLHDSPSGRHTALGMSFYSFRQLASATYSQLWFSDSGMDRL